MILPSFSFEYTFSEWLEGVDRLNPGQNLAARENQAIEASCLKRGPDRPVYHAPACQDPVFHDLYSTWLNRGQALHRKLFPEPVNPSTNEI